MLTCQKWENYGNFDEFFFQFSEISILFHFSPFLYENGLGYKNAFEFYELLHLLLFGLLFK